jgi:hypothetical protein
MVHANPFKAPDTQEPGRGSHSGFEFAPCPNCKNTGATKVGFTWWGGVLGSKVLTHVECSSCKTRYNGKTGRSNTTGIVIYTAVIAVVVGALLFAIN